MQGLGAEELRHCRLHARGLHPGVVEQPHAEEGHRLARDRLRRQPVETARRGRRVRRGVAGEVAGQPPAEVGGHRRRGHRQPHAAGVEGLQGVHLAVAGKADQVLRRNAHPVEGELVGGRGALAELVLVAAHHQILGEAIHHQAAHPRVGLAVEGHLVGDPAVGDPHLRAGHLEEADEGGAVGSPADRRAVEQLHDRGVVVVTARRRRANVRGVGED